MRAAVRFTLVVAASLHITAGVALIDLCGAPHKSMISVSGRSRRSICSHADTLGSRSYPGCGSAVGILWVAHAALRERSTVL